MKFLKYNQLPFILLMLAVIIGCSKDEDPVFEKTRLFRPVLNEPLMSMQNTIILNMGDIKEATGYTIEVSRDSFLTTDYTLTTDTSYVIIGDGNLGGDNLFWNTTYQVRGQAHAADPQYDSRVAEFGSVRTQRFPSILNVPSDFDVTDMAARVTWVKAGAPVTKVKLFSPDDLQLANPLSEYDVSSEEDAMGEKIVTQLESETTYQIGIFSGANGETLRGWIGYTTLPRGIRADDAGVTDLTMTEDPAAVGNAVLAASDGDILLLKKGIIYDFPSENLDKSITIAGEMGFGPQKSVLFTTGNWNIANGAVIDHIRFINMELRGEDPGGDYVFNPSNGDLTTVGELLFDNCLVNTFRGIIRIRGGVMIDKYTINNSIVHDIGGYGIYTTDTDGEGKASIQNISFTNSTFSKINSFITSRQNSSSMVFDNCTFSEFTVTGGRFFRYRGKEGFDNVVNGITISNCIFGHGWDSGQSMAYNVQFIADGLEGTSFSLSNNYGTEKFEMRAGSELAGFPDLRYNGSAEDLWVDPYFGLDFTIKDPTFSGRLTAGDPRWRPDF